MVLHLKKFVLRVLRFPMKYMKAFDRMLESELLTVQMEIQSKQKKNTAFFLNGFSERNAFFDDIRMITHAGGGIDGMKYLNAEEAFKVYYEKGNRVFEYDVQLSSDHKYILSHEKNGASEEDFLNQKIDSRFHPMKMEQLFAHMTQYKDITVIFDCKFRELGKFAEYLKANLKNEENLQRVVIQVFNEDNIQQIRKVYDYKMLHVCMYAADYNKIAECCLKQNIHAVSIPVKGLEERVGWDVFQKLNICIFAYTENSLIGYRKLRENGITGVFSDFLTVNTINRND